MNNKVVIGGNLKLKNTVSGQAKLNNVISGTPKSMIQVNGRVSGLTDAVKEALLDCFEHVAWIDDEGQVYYQALYDALYAKVLTSITAVFEQGQAVIYDDDSLDDLKQYLTVTANYDDGTSAVVTTYTLSGTLNPGTSSIQVSYENKKAYFNVNVTHRPGVVTITNNLTGCTTSNSDVSMTEGDPYTATITASSGYVLTGATVSITMGGTDITSTAYNNGTISIAEVTGSLVITITAVAVTLVSISAVYTQSGAVYPSTSLDSLKTDLVVTATYSDSSTATVPSADYTLSGTLAVGTSTVTVSYGGKTTTFSVTVTQGKSDMDGWADGIAYTDLEIVQNEYVNRNDGSFDSYTGWNRTGYVPINGASTLTVPAMGGSGGNTRYNAFYTSSHTWISSFDIAHGQALTITVPSNAYYFVLSESASTLAGIINSGVIPNA